MNLMLYVAPRSSPCGQREPVRVVEDHIDIDMLWQVFLLCQQRNRVLGPLSQRDLV